MTTKFELTKEQQERANAWFKHHWDVVHQGSRPRDSSGFACEYVFGETGCGCNVKIQCVYCVNAPQRECILTIDEDGDGDFLFQYDENWVKLPASWEPGYVKK